MLTEATTTSRRSAAVPRVLAQPAPSVQLAAFRKQRNLPLIQGETMPPTRQDLPRLNPLPTAVPEPAENEGDQPTPRKIERVSRITVEFSCLMCGRELGGFECSIWPVRGTVILAQPGGSRIEIPVQDLRRLRCEVCGGTALPTDYARGGPSRKATRLVR